jgi:autotransporter-associated beta strand protein
MRFSRLFIVSAVGLVLCATSAYAITLTTTNDVRALSGGGANNNYASDTALSLYNNGGDNIQRTWINFDLTPYFSSLAGKTLSAGVLSLVANTGMAGNTLNGASIASANAYWTKTSITWNTQPSTTAISGAINPVGGVADYDLVNWVIPAATLQNWIATQFTNGVCLTSASGSTLHFRSSRSGGTPTLTFTVVDTFTPASGIWTNTSIGNWTDGNNWKDGLQACGAGQSATFGETTGAIINLDTNRIISALAFSNATFAVVGANHTLALEKSPTTPSIFVGTGGTVSFSNILTSAEGLNKAGAGTLVLANGNNTLFGTTTVQGGTLRLASRYTLDKSYAVTLEPGTVLQCSTDWALGNTTGAGAGYVTVKSGATLRASSVANAIRHGITLSGGTIDATVAGHANYGNFILETPMTVNGTTSSTITADFRLRGSQTITVYPTGDSSGNDLFVSGKFGHVNGVAWGYLVKSGLGTMALSNAANEPGSYTVSQGKLLFIDKMAGGGDGGLINNAVTEARITTNATSYGYAISGSGTLLKTGEGRLFLNSATSSHSGPTVISNGTLSVSIMADAARHFDASRLTLTNGAAVTRWEDQSVTASHATVPSGNATPVFTSNAVSTTGLPAVYFAKNTGAATSGALQFTRDSSIRSIFSVFKGNSFLLTANDGSYHFHRTTDDNPANALWDNQYAHANLKNGSNYVNSAYVPTPTATAMPTGSNNGFNLIETITIGNVTADSFNKDRGNIHAGNQYHAEMIIFDSVVLEARRLQIEAYLNKKWFGIAPSSVAGLGNLMSINSPVTIYNGSTLDLSEVFYQTLASLSSTDGLGSKVLLGSTATLTVGNASSTTFDGVISGPAGNLIKTGSGVLTLTGTNTYAGVTSVTGGTLRVNGALAGGGPVMAFSNAIVCGSGLIAGPLSLALGATVSPGAGDGAIGTLTVGSLPLSSGGTLKIDVAANGTCDVLAVQGAADLSGTTLNLTGSSVLNRNYKYTLLTCSGTPSAFSNATLPGGWKVFYRNGSANLVSSGTMVSIY